jgi:hypothetical protein
MEACFNGLMVPHLDTVTGLPVSAGLGGLYRPFFNTQLPNVRFWKKEEVAGWIYDQKHFYRSKKIVIVLVRYLSEWVFNNGLMKNSQLVIDSG